MCVSYILFEGRKITIMTEKLRFYKKIYLSFRGMLFYKELLAKHKINKDTFIVIQESDDEDIISYGNIYLKDFLQANNFDDFVILTSDEYVKKLGGDELKAEIINAPVKKINWLMCLYCMYQFSRKILIFGIDKPSTNRLSKLIKTGMVTKEEAVAIGIYGLNNIKG